MADLRNIDIKGKIITYTLIRSKRRSIELRINKNGEIQVRAPFLVDESIIEDFIIKKSDWIIMKVEMILSHKENIISLKDGSNIKILGKEYQISIRYSNSNCIYVEDDLIVINHNKDNEQIKLLIKDFIIKICGGYIENRIHYFSKFFENNVMSFKIKEQKCCYGSCTYKNKIYLNWRIFLGPIEVVDYVLVHEMCHLDYKNHSKDFWRKVEEVMPDYKVWKKWLKENGRSLDIE